MIKKNYIGSFLSDYLEYYNISRKEFAERINVTPKHVIDILEGRVELSLDMMMRISNALDISIEFLVKLETGRIIESRFESYLKENNITKEKFINSFKLKDVTETYNLDKDKFDPHNALIIEYLMKYLRINDFRNIDSNLQTIFYKKKDSSNPFLLAFWLEFCTRKCYDQNINEYDSKKINELITFIQGEALKRKFDEQKLINKFNEYGIYLVIQDDVKGTNVRGASKVFLKNPAIFITRKYKRVADIYFVLLHELAHIKTDYNRARKAAIVSLEKERGVEDFEIKADKQALNWMVPDKIYNLIKDDLSLFNPKDKLSPFIVYRLAWDRVIKYNSKMYQDNNPIIID